jgi:hypothetical protein
MAALLTLALACCSSWGQPLARNRLSTEQAPRRARVSLADGRTIMVERPRLEGDSLFGDTLVVRNLDRVVPIAVAIPFADIGSVAAHGFSAGRTILLVLAIPVGAVGVCAILPGCLKVGM